MGLTFMEGWAVIPHVLAIVVLWSLSLFIGWSTLVQRGEGALG